MAHIISFQFFKHWKVSECCALFFQKASKSHLEVIDNEIIGVYSDKIQNYRSIVPLFFKNIGIEEGFCYLGNEK